MEHKEALLNCLAELRAVHDKASRLMADIAAIGASALKGGQRLPSMAQLKLYEQLVTQAQQHAAHCQHLLGGAAGPGRSADPPARQPALH
jgi:hypothetical protein